MKIAKRSTNSTYDEMETLKAVLAQITQSSNSSYTVAKKSHSHTDLTTQIPSLQPLTQAEFLRRAKTFSQAAEGSRNSNPAPKKHFYEYFEDPFWVGLSESGDGLDAHKPTHVIQTLLHGNEWDFLQALGLKFGTMTQEPLKEHLKNFNIVIIVANIADAKKNRRSRAPELDLNRDWSPAPCGDGINKCKITEKAEFNKSLRNVFKEIYETTYSYPESLIDVHSASSDSPFTGILLNTSQQEPSKGSLLNPKLSAGYLKNIFDLKDHIDEGGKIVHFHQAIPAAVADFSMPKRSAAVEMGKMQSSVAIDRGKAFIDVLLQIWKNWSQETAMEMLEIENFIRDECMLLHTLLDLPNIPENQEQQKNSSKKIDVVGQKPWYTFSPGWRSSAFRLFAPGEIIARVSKDAGYLEKPFQEKKLTSNKQDIRFYFADSEGEEIEDKIHWQKAQKSQGGITIRCDSLIKFWLPAAPRNMEASNVAFAIAVKYKADFADAIDGNDKSNSLFQYMYEGLLEKHNSLTVSRILAHHPELGTGWWDYATSRMKEGADQADEQPNIEKLNKETFLFADIPTPYAETPILYSSSSNLNKLTNKKNTDRLKERLEETSKALGT